MLYEVRIFVTARRFIAFSFIRAHEAEGFIKRTLAHGFDDAAIKGKSVCTYWPAAAVKRIEVRETE